MAEVCEMQRRLHSEGVSCNLHQFLDLALSCESVSATTGMSELVKFFAEYDQDNRGVICTNVFRRLMSDCGEKFTVAEVEEIIKAFKSKTFHECVDYHAFITTISSS
jgi:Ca2+-binding EF-hand superfamily protein